MADDKYHRPHRLKRFKNIKSQSQAEEQLATLGVSGSNQSIRNRY